MHIQGGQFVPATSSLCKFTNVQPLTRLRQGLLASPSIICDIPAPAIVDSFTAGNIN
jgi:hypothetical protein